MAQSEKPYAQERIETGTEDPASVNGAEFPSPQARAMILMVDDREDKCLAMRTVLEELGEEMIIAHSGRDALRLLLEREFAVILLDVNMPGLDGFETAHLIRQRKSLEHTPIIFITSISDSDTHVSRGYQLGAVDYILTPVLPDVLRTKVSVFVELFKKNQELKRQTEELREAHDELDARVKHRTRELAVANESLQKEAAERERAQEALRVVNAALEQRVAERTAALAAANQELEAFTYSVAHDLQAPLRNIQSYVEMLEEEWGASLAPEPAQYLTRIAARTKYVELLISGLLNLSIIGKQGLNKRPVELNGIVEEVVSTLKAEVSDRQIEWKISQLPAATCDPNLIKQVFANLLSNAVKYTKKRPAAVIELGQAAVDGIVQYYVRDNGVGFNMQYMDKLFGVFQRLHPQSEFEGTGVGLATVDRIIRKHGGRIWAEAEENKGATFYFTVADGSRPPEPARLPPK